MLMKLRGLIGEYIDFVSMLVHDIQPTWKTFGHPAKDCHRVEDDQVVSISVLDCVTNFTDISLTLE